MSRENYLLAIQLKTGKSIAELAEMAKAEGFGGDDVKPGLLMTWTKERFNLGHGHAMALTHALQGIHRASNP